MGLNSAKRPRSRCKMKTPKENPDGTALPVVAWEVEIYSMRCIVFATTAPKARWVAVRSYWEAGYGQKGMWPRPHAARCSAFDKSYLAQEDATKAYTWDYVWATC
jgi:hypothetical protein